MKKLKETVLVHKSEMLWILIFGLMVFGIIFNQPIQQNDESTLFNETKKMADGLTIYKDINVLVTPLFFYVGAVILKIFGVNYFVFRLYAVGIWLFLYGVVSQLLRQRQVSKLVIFLDLLLMTLFLKEVMVVSANYNMLAIGLSLLALLKYLEKGERDRKFYIQQGILLFLIFMTKQTIGAYHFLATAICELFLRSEKWKDKIKYWGWYSLPIGIGMLVYCAYLWGIGSLYEFIDYAFLGMLEFRQNATRESYVIGLVLVNVVPVIFLWNQKKLEVEQKILFLYSVVMLLIAYPILCEFHSKMALIFSLVSFFSWTNQKTSKQNLFQNSLLFIVSCYVCVMTSKNIANWYTYRIKEKMDPYFGAVYQEEINGKIENVVAYMREKEVVLVSPEVYLYQARLGTQHGILDLPLRGNVGLHGKEKIIEAIEELEDTPIMMTNYRYFQEYSEVYEYVAEHYEKVETVMSCFEVYEKR